MSILVTAVWRVTFLIGDSLTDDETRYFELAKETAPEVIGKLKTELKALGYKEIKSRLVIT